jgi:Bacterial Ig-like domain (group 2)/Beta xylosidase C-terminal Concanavalin A-like domain
MRTILGFLALAFVPWAQATTYTVNSSQSETTIQGVINGASLSDTVRFSAGTYNITSAYGLKCGITYTGPVANPATATITTTTVGITIFSLSGGCSSGTTTIQYLQLDGAGPLYVDTSNYSNVAFNHNQVTGLPFEPGAGGAVSSVYFDGDNTNSVSNITIEDNIFGDSNSCTAGLSTDDGTCAGVMFGHIAFLTNLTVRYNIFYHLSEGIHLLQVDYSSTPGAVSATCGNCDIEYNYFNGIVRIGLENQFSVQGAPTIISNNVFGNQWPTITYSGMSLSAACCYSGRVIATATTTVPSNYIQNNVMFNNLTATESQTPIGIEMEGAPQVTNNLVQGNFCTGVAYGGNFSAAVANNTLQGPYMSSGATCIFGPASFISSEAGASAPTISNNITGATPSSITSIAPTISPAAGLQTYPLKVTLLDPGYTSGNRPLGNTGIWYTTDGSNPVPGSGTAKYLANGGSFILSSPATVKAVGMWGARNQPTSYPTGYGFVPSPVISSVFTAGSGPRLVSAYLVPKGGVTSIPVGETLQFIAHGVYADGTSSVLPDSVGNAVTAWNTSDHAVAKISTLGHVTAMGVGTVTIEAFIGNLEASTAELAVTPVVASKVLVSAYLVPNGGAKSIPVGKTLQFIAHGVYADGTSSVLPDSEGNVVTAWNTSNHRVAKISSLGHVTAMGVGMATIKAFIGNLEASTSAVTVTPVIASSVQAPALESPLAPRLGSTSGSVPTIPGPPIGDQFLGPLWGAVTPNGGSASITDGHLVISVPGGSNHDTLGPSNDAARVVQPIGDTDFDVSIKIDSTIEASDAGTSRGLLALSDSDEFISFGLTSDGTNIGLAARIVNDGHATTVLEDTNFNQYQNPMYLRLTRSGVAYIAWYSFDGIQWTQATSFTYTGTLAFIGPFVSNYNNSPQNAVPVVMAVDWFNVE